MKMNFMICRDLNLTQFQRSCQPTVPTQGSAEIPLKSSISWKQELEFRVQGGVPMAVRGDARYIKNYYQNSIKKGSAKEIALASNAIGLLALTVAPGKKSQEILEEAITPISEALKSRSDSSKIASLLDCLAVITFVGGNEAEETDKCMQIMWQIEWMKGDRK
ncbi:uncharacterized protein LOC110914337 [Helianthus annuus]|uniref:uncharacterized protein LOC110914337 n=1 Tax=Helianthus annuus TaxID=4232 RepID=UPI000B8F7F29|nr:uncharacterized protein LOC110914337 [Helianthus annuus]